MHITRHTSYAFLVERGFEVTTSETAGWGFAAVLRRSDLRLRIYYDWDTGTDIEFANTQYDAWSPLRAVLWKLGFESTHDPWGDLCTHIDSILRFYDPAYVSPEDGLQGT